MLTNDRIGIVLSVGDRISCKSFGRIHSRFENALNFHLDDHLVSIVTPKLDPGPFRIIIDNIDLKKIGEVRLTLDDLKINHSIELTRSTAKAFRSAWRQDNIDPVLIRSNIIRLKQIVLNHNKEKSLAFLLSDDAVLGSLTPFDLELLKHYQAAYNEFKMSKIISSVNGFKGRGLGHTPSGDDFNTGLLMGLTTRQKCGEQAFSALRSQVYSNSLGSNLLVNTFLLQAYHGWYNENWKRLLSALAGKYDDLETTAQSILAQGETSGADLLTGFISAWDIDKEG